MNWRYYYSFDELEEAILQSNLALSPTERVQFTTDLGDRWHRGLVSWPESLHDQQREFLTKLAKHDVPHVIAGSYAILYYGIMPHWDVLHLWVDPDQKHVVEKLVMPPISGESAILASVELPLRVKIVYQVDGLQFNSAYERSEKVFIGDCYTYIASQKDVIHALLDEVNHYKSLSRQELMRLQAKQLGSL